MNSESLEKGLKIFAVALGVGILADQLQIGQKIVSPEDPYIVKMAKKTLVGIGFSTLQSKIQETV